MEENLRSLFGNKVGDAWNGQPGSQRRRKQSPQNCITYKRPYRVPQAAKTRPAEPMITRNKSHFHSTWWKLLRFDLSGKRVLGADGDGIWCFCPLFSEVNFAQNAATGWTDVAYRVVGVQYSRRPREMLL